MAKSNDPTLPSEVKINDIMHLLQQIRNRPKATEEDHSKRMDNSTFIRAKSALIELKLIERNQGLLTLTPEGSEIAWADEEHANTLILTNVVFKYEPYEVALSWVFKENPPVLTTDFIQPIWVNQLGIMLSKRKLGAAASTFLQFLDYCKLGEYKVGRRGKSTRLEFFDYNALKKRYEDYSLNKIDSSSDDTPDQALKAETNFVNQENPTEVESPPTDFAPKKPAQLKPSPDSSNEMQSNWTRLETELFILTIQKNSESWDLLESMMPLYRKSLKIE